MSKKSPRQKKGKKPLPKKIVPRKWGLASRLEHRRIKGKQKRE